MRKPPSSGVDPMVEAGADAMESRGMACITGIGIATSIGIGTIGFTNGLRRGDCGITTREKRTPETGGFLWDFDFERQVELLNLPEAWVMRARRAARRAPYSIQTSVVVALEAWQQAGLLEGERVVPERVSLVVAGQNISAGYQFAMMEKFREDPEYLPPSYGLHFLDTDHVGVISEVMGIRGEGGTVGGASASGNAALIQGLRLIRQEAAEVCVVVGALADLSAAECHALGQLGAMGGRRFAGRPQEASRPFDANRDGFIYGQGAACLVLESSGRVKERGAAVWGRLLGGSICLDGNRSSDLNWEGAARAMSGALRDAGTAAEQIDYINAHATSSVLGDPVEVEAIKKVFGRRAGEIRINSTKGLTGHCLWSAGVVEAAAAMVQRKEGFFHANRNLDDPIDRECRFVGGDAEGGRWERALSNSFGFGGINSAVVFGGA